MSFYAHRVNSFKLLAHVNRLMGVVHTTCRTTMLIAMYFGEYPIYLCLLPLRLPCTFYSLFVMCSVYIQTRLSELLYFYAILLYLAYGFTFWCSICPSRCVLKIYYCFGTVREFLYSSSHIYLLVLCFL